MDSERWHELEAVFQAALERAPDRRPAFLDEACAGDDSLKAQAQRLVASFEEAINFIETPAFQSAIQSRERDDEAATLRSGPDGTTPRWQAGLAVGQRIQQYGLSSLLGAGGMGEVYLAYDGRLDRQVALKLLPSHFTQDQTQVRRFEREARAASSLNHPNIITIHEIGQVDDVHFIATEFIEGQTLRQRIRCGSIPLNEVVDIACQIASALSAAHAAGIVHRDIKPENIMVRPDGLVKVLDFGLAKPLEREHATTGVRSQASIGLQTDPGMLMGTTSYLSPEQVRSDQIDHRTDIFSLGVVLYEMIAGERPFKGNSVAVTFDSILSDAPPAIVSRVLPAELEKIMHRALAKDPTSRYQTANEMKAELKQLDRGMESSDSSSPLRALRVKASLVLGALVLLAGAAYLSWRPSRESLGASVSQGAARHFQQTAGPGLELLPSLSPGGGNLVFASRAAGNWDLYAQPVRESDSNVLPDPINLTRDSPLDDTQPAFSPDGERIAFRSQRGGGGIFLMQADGQDVRRLTGFGYNPAWSRDGDEIVFSHANGESVSSRTPGPSALYAVNVKTEKRRILTDGDAVQPTCSPNGHRIAYWGMRNGGQRDIWTISTRGGDPVEVTNDADNDWNPTWSYDGRFLYFASDRDGKMNLWRIRIDEQSGETVGKAESVGLPGDYVQHFSLSKDGRSMAYVQQSQKRSIYQIGFDSIAGRVVGSRTAINPGSRLFIDPDISPDGEWLVFVNQGERQEDLFIMRRDGKGLTRITNDIHRDRGPRWAPDGKRIAFYSDRSGKYETWVINRDGTGLKQMTYTSERGTFHPVWSPDGSRLAYRLRGGYPPYIIETGKEWSEQTLAQLPAVNHASLIFGCWDWSSDGRLLAGWMENVQAPRSGITLYSFETHSFEKIIDFGGNPRWLNDDRRLIFYDTGALYLIDSQSRKVRPILSVAPDDIKGFTVSPDNRAIYFSVDSTEADIWLRTVE